MILLHAKLRLFYPHKDNVFSCRLFMGRSCTKMILETLNLEEE